MTMKHNRHLSTCVYMSVIAINDNLALSANLNVWLVQNTPFSVRGDLFCKILIYLVHIFGGFGAFEIVLMTLDKFIAIKMPHKSGMLCTAKRAVLFSVINFVAITVFYLPNIDFSKQVGPDRCARYVKQGWYVTVYTYLSLIVSPILPVTMLFFMNITIINAVWKSQRMRSANQTTQQDKNKSTEMQLTVMLILVSTLFVILLLPFEIREIYYSYVSKVETPKQYAVFLFIFDVTYELYNLNYGINFFLYFLSGTRFRRDLLTLLGIQSRKHIRTTTISTVANTIDKRESITNFNLE